MLAAHSLFDDTLILGIKTFNFYSPVIRQGPPFNSSARRPISKMASIVSTIISASSLFLLLLLSLSSVGFTVVTAQADVPPPQSTPIANLQQQESFLCPFDGYYPDPWTCSDFYICNDGQAVSNVIMKLYFII